MTSVFKTSPKFIFQNEKLKVKNKRDISFIQLKNILLINETLERLKIVTNFDNNNFIAPLIRQSLFVILVKKLTHFKLKEYPKAMANYIYLLYIT